VIAGDVKMDVNISLNDEIAAALVHEVKNPVGLISMNVELIKKESRNRWEKNFVVIEKELSKLNKIVTDYKTILCRSNNENEKIFIADLISEIIEEYDISVAEKNITFGINGNEDIYLFGNYNKMCILFFNIIKNAVEAIENTGKIDANIYLKDETVVCEIIDNGCGMDESIANKIGTPYISGKKNGTGLGMVICKSIATEQGGCISINNAKDGKGCIVRVCLPIRQT
jgi:nitrogen fixation/metabolism regulation signal transduction histidine kinase